MGGKQSMSDDKATRLTKEELNNISGVFKSMCVSNPEKGCTYEDFLRFCETMHPLLIQFLVEFYFADNSENIIRTVKEFASFYLHLVRGSIEDKAKVMEIMLYTLKNDSTEASNISGATAFRKLHSLQVNYELEDTVFKIRIENYLRGLICSYIKLEYNAESPEFMSWRQMKASFSPKDVDKLAKTLTDYLPHHESIEDFQQWARTWITTKWLHYVVYSQLFGLEYMRADTIKCLYPLSLVRSSRYSCILDMCSILHINSHLPPKYKTKWKLLFSTSIHGVNYRHLMARILFEGPNLVVIRDKFNHVFGGFAAESWRPCKSFYGNCSSFLFQSKPHLKVFEASGRDENYQYINVKRMPRGFGMGQGTMGHYAWWIDLEHQRGTCAGSCTTFNDVPILASTPNFQIRDLEVWCVDEQKVKVKDDKPWVRVHALSRIQREHESNLRTAGRSLFGTSRYTDGYAASRKEHVRNLADSDSVDSQTEAKPYEEHDTDESESDDDEEEGEEEDDYEDELDQESTDFRSPASKKEISST